LINCSCIFRFWFKSLLRGISHDPNSLKYIRTMVFCNACIKLNLLVLFCEWKNMGEWIQSPKPAVQARQFNKSVCVFTGAIYRWPVFFFYILLGRNKIIRAKQKDIVTFLVIFTFVFSVWVLELPIFLQSISACKLPCHGEHKHCFLFLIEFLYSIQAHVLLFFLFKYLFFKILWIECFWFSKLNLFMLRNLSSAIC
jgi:hypothetical protein